MIMPVFRLYKNLEFFLNLSLTQKLDPRPGAEVTGTATLKILYIATVHTYMLIRHNLKGVKIDAIAR